MCFLLLNRSHSLEEHTSGPLCGLKFLEIFTRHSDKIATPLKIRRSSYDFIYSDQMSSDLNNVLQIYLFAKTSIPSIKNYKQALTSYGVEWRKLRSSLCL